VEETMTESELRRRFEDLTLPAEAFSHREHVRLAWVYLREHSLLEVLRLFPENLKRFAASIGAAAVYHETVTWAFLVVIDERMDGMREIPFDDFIAANADLLEKPVLQHHYDEETLASEAARRRFVLPRRVSAV
jgi:hypothetical protein